MKKEMRKEKAVREAIITILKPFLPFVNDKSIIRAYQNLVSKFPEIITFTVFSNITNQYKNEKQRALELWESRLKLIIEGKAMAKITLLRTKAG